MIRERIDGGQLAQNNAVLFGTCARVEGINARLFQMHENTQRRGLKFVRGFDKVSALLTVMGRALGGRKGPLNMNNDDNPKNGDHGDVTALFPPSRAEEATSRLQKVEAFMRMEAHYGDLPINIGKWYRVLPAKDALEEMVQWMEETGYGWKAVVKQQPRKYLVLVGLTGYYDDGRESPQSTMREEYQSLDKALQAAPDWARAVLDKLTAAK